MGLMETLGRIPKILEANINAMLDKCEDPAKMIDQLLIDYKRDLADVKRDTQAVMADVEIARKKLADCDAEIEKKQRAAQNALKAGDEDAARQILASKQSLEKTRTSYANNLELAEKNADTMKAGYNKLVQTIEELEQRKDAAKQNLSMAKAQQRINETAAKASRGVDTSAFDKYEQKAERALAEAQAGAELDANSGSVSDLTEKYAGAGNDSAVDDELAKMKAEMGLA